MTKNAVATGMRTMPILPEGIRKIHLIGIAGTAMGSLAAMLKESGYEVRGSDAGAYPPMSTWLEAREIEITTGWSSANLDWEPDLVVVGNVCRSTYADAVETERRGIPFISMPEALRHFFMQGKKSVVITGTHGKTTTSSLVAWILTHAGLDPTFMVGGITGNFDSNYRLGEGEYFVVEGDEYDTAYFDKRPKFVHYQPYHAVITNVEFDHADIYADLDAIKRVFRSFSSEVPKGGSLWVNGNDSTSREVAAEARHQLFGLTEDLDLYACNLQYVGNLTSFEIYKDGTRLGDVQVSLVGEFNVRNVLAATALALECGVGFSAIQNALRAFLPPKKRQQVIFDAHDITIVDDFAHHPTAVAATLKAFRTAYPGRRLVAVFEAKSNTSRRRVFQHEYAEALSIADEVILSAPWKKDTTLAPEDLLDFDLLVSNIAKGGTSVEKLEDVDSIVANLSRRLQPGDLVLGLSGSAFGGFHSKLADAITRNRGGDA